MARAGLHDTLERQVVTHDMPVFQQAQGYGRELATAGIHEFTNIRTFWVQAAGTPPPATLTE